MEQLYMRYPKGRSKALTLSYDDSLPYDVRLIEILNRYGIKCTFNVCSGWVKNSEDLCKLYAEGEHEIAVHTVSHPRLDLLSPANITYEVLQDRIALERCFGRIVRGMAYPGGYVNDTIIECLRSCGIVYSRTTVSTECFDLPTDWMRLPSTCHHDHPRLRELADRFLNEETRGAARLFYLWGHSSEFEKQQRWNIIEDFAAQMGNREDIWYATNIEIYNYVKAYEALEFSADRILVHNPTAMSVWVCRAGGKLLEIAPDATLQLT